MRSTLSIRNIECYHCKQKAYNAIPDLMTVNFEGDGDPYISEDHKETLTCDHCHKTFTVRATLSVKIDE